MNAIKVSTVCTINPNCKHRKFSKTMPDKITMIGIAILNPNTIFVGI